MTHEKDCFLQAIIVDASLIAAPKSTKNQKGKRDPEMHQTKKSNEWYFRMKVHARQYEIRTLLVIKKLDKMG